MISFHQIGLTSIFGFKGPFLDPKEPQQVKRNFSGKIPKRQLHLGSLNLCQKSENSYERILRYPPNERRNKETNEQKKAKAQAPNAGRGAKNCKFYA